jgi:hypothetical protein
MRSFVHFCAVILVFLFLSPNLNAQEDKNTKKKDFKPYLFSGGSLWLGFGTYTFVDVNLVFGSQLTERINIGTSGKYQYVNDKRSIDGNFETSVYGGSVFSQIAIVKDFRNLLKVKGHSGIIAHLEYEFLNTKYNYLYFNSIDTNDSRYWLHNILIGGGYFQQMGKKSKSFIIILWNINPDNRNPYTYPQIRIGFNIGF